MVEAIDLQLPAGVGLVLPAAAPGDVVTTGQRHRAPDRVFRLFDESADIVRSFTSDRAMLKHSDKLVEDVLKAAGARKGQEVEIGDEVLEWQ